MKINICKTLDVGRLKKAIEDYYYKTSQTKMPYLFMSETTIKNLADIGDIYDKYFKTNRSVPLYQGYKIFIDDDLEYGEIELR